MNGKSRPFGRPSQLTPMSSPDDASLAAEDVECIYVIGDRVVGARLVMTTSPPPPLPSYPAPVKAHDDDEFPDLYGPLILDDPYVYRRFVGSTSGRRGPRVAYILNGHLVVENTVAVRDDGMPYGSPSPANQKALRAAHGRALRAARRAEREQR